MKRPLEISVAAVLLILVALAAIALPLLNIGGVSDPRAAALPAGNEAAPSGAPDMQQMMGVIRWVAIGMQALGLIVSVLAAFGLWRLRKWGYWLALVLGILKVLSGIPLFLNRAIPVSPLTFSQLSVGLIVLIFLLLKDSREAFFPERR
jgi:hypothetical protein